MENEFDDNFYFPEAEPTATLTAEPPAQTVDPAAFLQLQEQLNENSKALRVEQKRNQDLYRVLSANGEPPQDPEAAFLDQLASKPLTSVKQTARQVMQEVLNEDQTRRTIEERYSKEYPHLVEFKQEVINTAGMFQQQAYSANKPITDDEAIAKAVQHWDQRIDATASIKAKQNFALKNALPYAVTGSNGKAYVPDFSKMSNAEFESFEKQKNRQ